MSRRTANNRLDLSTMAEYGRNGIKYGALLLIFYIIARFTWSTGKQLYLSLNPPGPPPPTMGFNKLPPPSFPTQLPDERPTEFVLETVGNRLPTFGSQVAVYFIPGYEPDLLALDRAKERAASLGFLFEPEKISATQYRWRQRNPLPATLEMNVANNSYNMEADWASSITLLDKKFLPDERQATSELRSLLRSVDLYQNDVATASPKIKYLKALAGQTREAASISEADFVQVDLYRNTKNNLPSVTQNYQQGVIRAIFSGSRDTGERLLSFQSTYYPILWEKPETYPLQSARQAWEQLLAGEGYVTSKENDRAVVRSVYLAYFEPALPGTYYQPVYVFEGDHDFQALVPALNPQVYQSTQ